MDNGAPPFGNLEADVRATLCSQNNANIVKPSTFDLGFNLVEEGGALENFDFDSFLQNPNDDAAFNLGGEFDFNHVEVGGDL